MRLFGRFRQMLWLPTAYLHADLQDFQSPLLEDS